MIITIIASSSNWRRGLRHQSININIIIINSSNINISINNNDNSNNDNNNDDNDNTNNEQSIILNTMMTITYLPYSTLSANSVK